MWRDADRVRHKSGPFGKSRSALLSMLCCCCFVLRQPLIKDSPCRSSRLVLGKSHVRSSLKVLGEARAMARLALSLVRNNTKLLPARQREKEGGDDRDVIYAATKTDLAWEVEGAKTRGEA